MNDFVVLIWVQAALVGLELEAALSGLPALGITARTAEEAMTLAASGTFDLALIEHRDDSDTPRVTDALKQNRIAHFAFDNRVFRDGDTIKGAAKVFPYPFSSDDVMAAVLGVKHAM